jgi:hypothetical protein
VKRFLTAFGTKDPVQRIPLGLSCAMPVVGMTVPPGLT